MFKYALLALATTSAFANATLSEKENPITNPVIIADTVKQFHSLSPTNTLSKGRASVSDIQVSKAGAEFIKVHFSYFNLPTGAYVLVSDQTGNERYRYDGIQNQKATYSTEKGENGLTQFSAMSVFGDTANITLVMPEGAVWLKEHGIRVDRFNAGTSKAVLADGSETPVNQFSTCGVNERTDVACWESSHPVEFERTRPVARLLMGGSGLCTGWRVGSDNHMFTNNHCLDDQSTLANTEIWFNYQKTTCGGSSYAGTIKVTGKDLLKTDYDLDYSLFTVNNFANIASFGNFGLDARAPSLGEVIYIPQHGSGNPKELSIDSDQNASGKCEIDVASANGRGTNTDTGYFCDTIGGSSGSPVLAASSNKVIALHHFGGCENQGVRIDKIWPQVSSYFNGVPPVGDSGTPTGNQAPVAQASISCSALSCSFDGSGSSDVDGTVVSHAWNFGDSSSLNGANVNHTYANNGTYTVTLTVTDDGGKTDTYSESVAVSDNASNELQSGVSVDNLSAAKDGEVVYFINTTQNNTTVTVNMSGGTGDADLYVKRGGVPTKTDYDCRPYANGNNESCTAEVGTPDSVYVKLIGYSAFSGVSVVATNSVVTPSDFPKTNLSGSNNAWDRYTYSVPAGVSQVVVSTTGGTGDADLYVRKGAEPSTTTYDCRPYKNGNAETCTVAVAGGDTVHIGIRAYSDYTGLTLNVQ
jgi:serine protease